jgi:hypothetical protein
MPRHRRANENQNNALPSVETQRFVATPRHYDGLFLIFFVFLQ